MTKRYIGFNDITGGEWGEYEYSDGYEDGIEDVLLCAERDVRQVEGCDLGNSPSEYTEEVVKDRLLVLATTNGSGAILEARGASRVLIAGYVNASRIIAAMKKEKE